MTTPLPQVIVLFSVALLLFGGVWSLLAWRSGLLRKSRVLSSVGVFGVLLALFCNIFTFTMQPTLQVSSNNLKEKITFTTYNRLYETKDMDKPTDYMRLEGSDIISLQEVSDPDYAAEFAKKLGFSYSHQSSDNDTALISRWPIKNSVSLQNGLKNVVRAEIESPYGELAAYAVHVVPPFDSDMYKEEQKQLKVLSDWIAKDRLPTVIGGDYNTAMYSPEMREHTEDIAHKVKSTTQKSWPTCNKSGSVTFKCYRIDHVYIPSSSDFHGSEISPDLGSDHRAVTVTFSL